MFWKIIRWGGTAILVLVVIAAVLLNDSETSTPAPDETPVATKKFNF